MGFRWFALIALWTLLAGPVLHHPRFAPSSAQPESSAGWAARNTPPAVPSVAHRRGHD